MEVASQHCDTVPNKTKDILDFRLKKKKLHDSRAQLPVQSRVDQNIKKIFGYFSHKTVKMPDCFWSLGPKMAHPSWNRVKCIDDNIKERIFDY